MMQLKARGPRRLRLAAVAMAVAACGTLAVPASGLVPVRAAGPTIVATPSTNLADGQFVNLAFSGFPPSIGVVFRECKASPVNVATDCTAINTQVIAVIDATGAGSTYLPVYEGSDPAMENAGNTGTVPCDANHACVIAGVRDQTDLVSAVFVPVSFGLSPDLCPPPSSNGVLGSGSATVYRAMYAWESAVCGKPSSLSVAYALNNSVDGANNFGNGLTDFGVVGPVPPFQLPSTAPSFKYAPLTTSAVVLAFRIYDVRGQQITHLTLTPYLIAQIFEGLIPDWAVNPNITYLNPGVEFPGRIIPFARAEHSAETYAFTSWLTGQIGGLWPGGAQSIFPEPPVGVTGVTTSSALGRAVANPLTTWFTQGNIGFMDSSTAAFYGLPTVTIRRTDLSLISATPATIAQAVLDAKTNPDGTITPNYRTLDPLAYPMPITSYMLVPTNHIAPSKGVTLAAFLRYAVQAGQRALPTGYAPLPQSLVNETLTVAGEIPVKAPPTPRPSPTPNPTPSYTFNRSGGGNPGGGGSFPTAAATGSPTPVSTVCRTPAASAAASPSASVSTSPSPGAKSSPSPSASASPAPHPSPSATPCIGSGSNSGSTQSAAPPWLLSESGANYALPSLIVIGLIGLIAGPVAEWLSRRRRAGGGAEIQPRTAGEGVP
jgi:ABC-type phosphate transport system substrate-binding protein